MFFKMTTRPLGRAATSLFYPLYNKILNYGLPPAEGLVSLPTEPSQTLKIPTTLLLSVSTPSSVGIRNWVLGTMLPLPKSLDVWAREPACGLLVCCFFGWGKSGGHVTL